MKIACFSDLHSHMWKEFDEHSDRTGSKRLDIILDSIQYIKDYCLSNNINYILFGGDMFHSRARVNTAVYNATYDAIKSIGESDIKIVMIPGNHDSLDNSDIPENSLHPFKELKNVMVCDAPTINILEQDTPDATVLVCLPFSKNVEGVKQTIQNLAKEINPNTPSILLTHLGVSGAVVGNDSYPMQDAFTIEDLRPDFFKYIVLGHYHKRQFLGGYPHVFYTGSPLEHSFNDEGETHGFYIMDTCKRWDVQFVQIPSPRFYTMDAYDVANEDMQSMADRGDYIRLMCTEKELSVALTYLPSNLQYKTIITKEYTEETRVDVKIGMSFSDIITKYGEEFNPEAVDIGLEILQEVEGNR